MQDLIDLGKKVAIAGGKEAMNYFRKSDLSFKNKSTTHFDPVSKADENTENIMNVEISKESVNEYKSHEFLSRQKNVGTTESDHLPNDLSTLEENLLLQILDGVPKVIVSRKVYESLPTVIELLTEGTKGLIFKSKGEARRLIQGGGMSINKEKINSPDAPVGFVLLNNKYILIQKGKKNYYLIIVED